MVDSGIMLSITSILVGSVVGFIRGSNGGPLKLGGAGDGPKPLGGIIMLGGGGGPGGPFICPF